MANVKIVKIKIDVDSGEVVKAEQDFDSLNSSVTKGSKQMTTSLGNMKTSLIGIGAALGGLAALKAVVGDAAKRIIAFEKSISSLSAITGAVGKDLDRLKGLVLEVAGNTKRSATEIAGAFELIGSKAPQLLENADALAAVTEEAITLSKASGGDLVESAGALTGVMNQFNLSASESGRIINVLAAGSQKGAAPVGDIAAAIDKFGTVAAAANVSVESSVGLVETLAEKNINGAEAGTQLRNIILKLQSANIGFTDGVFNLNDALEEVKNKNLSAAESAKLFGLESVTAGNILVNGTDTVNKYTEAVTGTSTAYDQAIIQTDNLATKTQELDATYESFLLSIEDGNGIITESLKGVVAEASGFLELLTDLNNGAISFEDGWKIAINSVIKSFSILLKPMQLLLEGVDKLAGTDLASALDPPQFELARTKVDALDKAFKSINSTQLDTEEVAKRIVNEYVNAGLSAEEAFEKYQKLRGETESINAATDEGTEALDRNTQATNSNSASKEKQLTFFDKLKQKIDAVKKSQEEASTLETIFTDDVGDEDTGLDEDFLKAEGLDDESLEKRKEAIEEKQLQDEDEKVAKLESDVEFNELLLENENATAEARAEINSKTVDSAVNLASALIGLAGDSQAAQISALTFEKAVSIARVITGTQAANAAIFAEGAALAIPTAGASTAAAAGLIAANNANAAINIAAIVATAIPQIKSVTAPKKLKDGEIMIDGAGTETSDSIPAMLSKNESVINARSSKKHTAALKAINDDRFDDYLNRVIIQEIYRGKKQNKDVVINSNPNDIKFPEGMSIKNANSISRPIVEALEDMNFLSGAGWD